MFSEVGADARSLADATEDTAGFLQGKAGSVRCGSLLPAKRAWLYLPRRQRVQHLGEFGRRLWAFFVR